MLQINYDYLKKCKEEELDTNDSIALYLLYNKEFIDSEYWLATSWDKMQINGYIKVTGDTSEDIEFRQKFLDLLPIEVKQDSTIESWIDSWRNLWPTGVKSGGYYIKGNKEDLLTKMHKFLKKYKYSKEQVFEGTTKYLNERKVQGWTYTMCSEYFIEKNNTSKLASYCANIGVKEETKSINKMI